MFSKAFNQHIKPMLIRGKNEGKDNVLIPLAVMMIGTGINFLMFILIARILTTDQFSQFAFGFTLLSLCAAIGVLGQGDLIFKTWNHHLQQAQFGLTRGAFIFGVTVSTIGGLLAGLFAAGFYLYKGADPTAAASYFIFAILFTSLYFFSPATRAISGFVAGDGNMEITWRIVTIIGLSAAVLIGFDISVTTVLMTMSFGILLALLLNFLAIARSAPKQVLKAKGQLDLSDWKNRSFRMWLSDIIANLSLHIDILVIGLFIDPALAGGYFVAMRLANIFKRLTAAFANYASRHIAPLHFSGAKDELRGNMTALSKLALILVVGGLLALLIMAESLLSLFGNQYTSEIWTLVVLAGGAGITTLAGPAPNILLHTGHESRYLTLLAIGLALRCVLLIILTPIYGTLGAAIASTFVSIVLAILLNIACRKTVGIDPSIFALRSATKAS